MTFVSGLSHFKVGNVDKELFKKLTIPGCVFACLGAFFLVSAPIWLIKPTVSIYLGIMGMMILLKAFNISLPMCKLDRHILAAVRGFMDAIGGGGWGPIVTSTLIADGEDPAKVIGSVNFSEFFVTLCESITFLALLGLQHLLIILGLIIGGVIAAPIGAVVCKKVPRRGLMLIVSISIICLSIRGLTAALR